MLRQLKSTFEIDINNNNNNNNSNINKTILNFSEYLVNDESGNNNNNNGEWVQQYDNCHSFTIYLQFLYTYYIPFIIAIGFVGNFLSALVFLTTHLKMRSSSYYLAALAISDFGFLFVVLLVFCSYNNIFEVFNRNGWCQFFVYLSSVCASMSVWLTVAFTVERFIAIKYPLQRPYICTVSRAKMIVIFVTMLALITHLYIFWIAGLIQTIDNIDNNENNISIKIMECEMLPDYEQFAKIVNFIDTVLTLIVPLLLIITMNTMIARNLLNFKKRLQFQRSLDVYTVTTSVSKVEMQISSSQQSSNSNNKQQPQHLDRQSSESYYKFNLSTKKYSSSLRKKSSTKPSSRISIHHQDNINKMLLIISSVFVALNFPSYVIRLYIEFGLNSKIQSEISEKLWCAQQFAMLLFYTNFSINFMLYAMCGETFRHCLLQLLRNVLKKIYNGHNI